MNLAIIIILVIAIGLIIFSYIKQLEQTKNLQKQIDHVTFLVTDELYKMNNSVKDIQLDLEITTNEEKTIEMADSTRSTIKKMILMQRSGYSVDSIAEECNLPKEEVVRVLAPYKESRKRDA